MTFFMLAVIRESSLSSSPNASDNRRLSEVRQGTRLHPTNLHFSTAGKYGLMVSCVGDILSPSCCHGYFVLKPLLLLLEEKY
jgi:hypothetical protein